MKTLTILIMSGLLCSFSFIFQAHSETEIEYEFSQAELDQVLAPIALYPDTVLSHILIASTYPLEVIQAERWTRENANLKADAALSAVESKDWDPSVKALVPFPEVLKKMSEDLDWMQKLGDAFLQNEELVLASVQQLRQRAYDEGSLKDLEHLNVSRENDQIVIEPSVREVVYVPYYDTRVVYGNWWWVDYPPVYWSAHNHHYSGAHFFWSPRIHVGTGFYFSSVHWHNHRVVVVDRRYAHRHRFYSGRQVVRHANSRAWVHNTRHRRGVEYRRPRVSQVRSNASYRPQRDAQSVSKRLQQNGSRSSLYHSKNRAHAERVRKESRHSNTSERNNKKWHRTDNKSRERRTNTGDRRNANSREGVVVRQAQPTRTYHAKHKEEAPKTFERPTRSERKTYGKNASDRSTKNSRTSSSARSGRSTKNTSRQGRADRR